MKNTRLYPRVQVDTAPVPAVAQAGGVTLTETLAATGLDGALSRELAGWRRPLAVHDPAKVVLDLALTVALGGRWLSDVDIVRSEPEVYGLVASDPTVSRTIDALAEAAPSALAAIDRARAQARALAWAHAGKHAPDHEATAKDPVVIDLDATLITSHSEKEQAERTWKKGYGFHPLAAFVDHGPRIAHGGHRGTTRVAPAPRERGVEHRYRPHRGVPPSVRSTTGTPARPAAGEKRHRACRTAVRDDLNSYGNPRTDCDTACRQR